jgi:hypothetical protein
VQAVHDLLAVGDVGLAQDGDIRLIAKVHHGEPVVVTVEEEHCTVERAKHAVLIVEEGIIRGVGLAGRGGIRYSCHGSIPLQRVESLGRGSCFSRADSLAFVML